VELIVVPWKGTFVEDGGVVKRSRVWFLLPLTYFNKLHPLLANGRLPCGNLPLVEHCHLSTSNSSTCAPRVNMPLDHLSSWPCSVSCQLGSMCHPCSGVTCHLLSCLYFDQPYLFHTSSVGGIVCTVGRLEMSSEHWCWYLDETNKVHSHKNYPKYLKYNIIIHVGIMYKIWIDKIKIQLRMRARLYTHVGVPLTNSHVLWDMTFHY